MFTVARAFRVTAVVPGSPTSRSALLASELESARQRASVSLGLLAAALLRSDFAAVADAAQQAQLDLASISGFARLLARE